MGGFGDADNGFACRAIRRAGRFGGGWLRCSGVVDYTVVQAVERKFETIGDAQLVIHFAQVIFHHLLGGTDADGDFLVLHALRDAGNNQ